MKFDRDNVRLMRNRLQAALEGFAKDIGCEVHIGGATYERDGSNCTFKVELAVVGAGGVARTREMNSFKALATLYGLKPEDFGAEFTVRGEKYRITGANPRSGKYPIIAERVKDGKAFKFGDGLVRTALGRASPPVARGRRPAGWPTEDESQPPPH